MLPEPPIPEPDLLPLEDRLLLPAEPFTPPPLPDPLLVNPDEPPALPPADDCVALPMLFELLVAAPLELGDVGVDDDNVEPEEPSDGVVPPLACATTIGRLDAPAADGAW